MCLNCGCDMLDDNMGNDDNITVTKLAKAAKASGQTAKELLDNLNKYLPKITEAELQKKIDSL